jgi:hypothetical protein
MGADAGTSRSFTTIGRNCAGKAASSIRQNADFPALDVREVVPGDFLLSGLVMAAVTNSQYFHAMVVVSSKTRRSYAVQKQTAPNGSSA